MARRRPSLAADASYWAWWLRSEGGVLLLGLGVAVLFALLGAALLSQSKQPAETLDAVILRFGAASHYEGSRPIVVARTADGRLHQLLIDASTLAGCTAGDPIRLTKRGGIVALRSAPCARAAER